MHFKRDRLTSEDRIKALFDGCTPDRVPLGMMSTGFNTVNAGMTVYDAYADPEKSFTAMQWTTEQYGWDPVPQYAGHTVHGAWDFGGDVRLPVGEYEGGLMVKSHPVHDENDVSNLQLPDPKTAGRIPVAFRFAELQAQQGLPVFFFSRSPFTMAANIADTEQFLRWTMKKPDLCYRLLDLAIEHIFNVLSLWVERFGADNVFVWMSNPSESNQLISPRIMEKFALPYHEKYHRCLKELNIKRFGMHICGDQNLNLPLLAEAALWPHPSVLSFGHEVDLETAAEYFPEDIIFGNIEPVVIQIGTPQQVYDLCRTAIEKGKKAPGGFILGPGCGLPIYSPPVNVYALTKAVNDFGWYV
jgi:uroporphyrinogen decarboxylase